MTQAIEAMTSEERLRNQILDLVSEYAELVHAKPPFNPETSPVPVSGKVFGAEELRYLVDSSLEFWLTTGRYNRDFERALSKILSVKNVMTTNSGSSANLLAFSSLTSHMLGERAITPGAEVITVASGFPTTINPIIQYQAVPVFVDVSLPTYNIDVNLIEQAITEQTRAIMIAHTLGNPFDLDRVKEIANKYDLWLVEDCCDALGTTYKGKPTGSFGDVGTLSFYPAHHITMGEGGAVFTKHSILKRVVESMRDWGRDCWCEPGKDNTCKKRFSWHFDGLPPGYDHKYVYSHAGYNLKITDMQAAIGLAQLMRLDGFIASRKHNFRRLYEGLSNLEEYFVLPEATPGSDPSWFGFLLTVKDGAPFTRAEIVMELNQRRIATRYLFAGNVVNQPYMKRYKYRISGNLNNSDKIMKDTFWLGCFPALTDKHIDYIVETIQDFVGKR